MFARICDRLGPKLFGKLLPVRYFAADIAELYGTKGHDLVAELAVFCQIPNVHFEGSCHDITDQFTALVLIGFVPFVLRFRSKVLGHDVAIFYLRFFEKGEEFFRLGLHFLVRFALISVAPADVEVERDQVRCFLDLSFPLYIEKWLVRQAREARNLAARGDHG